jgi:hypothetical protein
MSLDSEEAVKKSLGIRTFRELSKEKVLAFAATMPDMASEVRLKLVEQIPGFQQLALKAVRAVQRTYEKTVEANQHSEDQVHDAFRDVRRIIEGQLGRDDLSDEHRRILIEQIIDSAQRESDKDSEGKQFLVDQASSNRKAVLVAIGLTVIAAIVMAGGSVRFGESQSPA